jgi:putative oxidoreductase
MKITALIGRILFSLMFLQAVGFHFTNAAASYGAAAGVPYAGILVPISGILALIGGLCILLGFKARFGAWLIVLFLIPVTFMMHAFWTIPDPAQAQVQYAMFFKNLSMLGGAFLITYFGSGPYSLDNIGKRRSSIEREEKRIERKEKELEHATMPFSEGA